MSLSKHDGTADLLPFSCRRGPTMSSHTEVCRPPCHLWGHCCDTGLVLDYRRAEGDSGPQMHGCLGGICFSFLWKALKWEGVPFAWAWVAGAEPVCCLFPCLFSWSSPSPLSVLLNKTCWSSPAQLKPMAALVASACHKVPLFGPWWRQKMWGALNYTRAKATVAVLSGTISPFLTCTPQSLRLWTFWGRGLIFAHPSAEIWDYNWTLPVSWT